MNKQEIQKADDTLETEEALPTIYDDKLPEIPEEIMENLISTAEDVVIWVKPKGNGFLVDDTTAPLPEIVGRIVEINPYLVKWENNQPDKLPYIKDELDWPEGYEPRCDVVLMTPGGGKIGISLAKSSFKRQFCPYIKTLMDKGVKPTEVVTRFLTWEAKTNLGAFNVVKPTLVDPREPTVTTDLEVAEDGDIPF